MNSVFAEAVTSQAFVLTLTKRMGALLLSLYKGACGHHEGNCWPDDDVTPSTIHSLVGRGLIVQVPNNDSTWDDPCYQITNAGYFATRLLIEAGQAGPLDEIRYFRSGSMVECGYYTNAEHMEKFNEPVNTVPGNLKE